MATQGLDGEMINKTKSYNKSSGLQGIGDTIKLMNEYDMNNLCDTIAPGEKPQFKDVPVSKYSKNS